MSEEIYDKIVELQDLAVDSQNQIHELLEKLEELTMVYEKGE